MSSKPETLTDLIRPLSQWHFDPSIPENSFQGVGLFDGDWHSELKVYLDEVNSKGLGSIITLGGYSGRSQHTEKEEMELWGYPPTQAFVHCITAENALPFPKFVEKIIAGTGLIDPVAEILRIKPGFMLPWHADMYNSYRKRFGDEGEIVRYAIALDNWDWGHYLAFGNSVWHQWKRGQAVTWPRYMYHCVANCGRRSMLHLVVTGKTGPRSLHRMPLQRLPI